MRVDRALGLVRRDIYDGGVDLYRLAERHGYRVVWTVRLDTAALTSGLIVASAVIEHKVSAVVVPTFEHAESVRHIVTDLAALVTSMCHYPRGYRWPVAEL